MELGKRKEKILAAIVEQYIATGEPVGSKSLCEALDMSVSSATIRNEMSELSEMKYLEQPHTSAGRIPSEQGYRYYVDKLMRHRQLTSEEQRKIRAMLPEQLNSMEEILSSASGILAELTGCAAFSSTPAGESAMIRRVELIPMGKYMTLLVLMTTTGMIKHRICRLDLGMNEDTVTAFYNIVNQYFVGSPVAEVSTVMIQTLAASLGEKAFAVIPLLAGLADLANEAAEADIHFEGQTNLLSKREYEGNIRELLDFFKRREALLKILSAQNNGLHVRIGSENLFRELSGSSMILSNYSKAHENGGLIGIIGPTRIDYAQLIPNIEYLTSLVSKLLSEALEEE